MPQVHICSALWYLREYISLFGLIEAGRIAGLSLDYLCPVNYGSRELDHGLGD